MSSSTVLTTAPVVKRLMVCDPNLLGCRGLFLKIVSTLYCCGYRLRSTEYERRADRRESVCPSEMKITEMLWRIALYLMHTGVQVQCDRNLPLRAGRCATKQQKCPIKFVYLWRARNIYVDITCTTVHYQVLLGICTCASEYIWYSSTRILQ